MLRREEIVLILPADLPLAESARPKDSFNHSWIDLALDGMGAAFQKKRYLLQHANNYIETYGIFAGI